MNNIFPDFPDSSRVWIYSFKEDLSSSDIELVKKELNHFIKSWKSHDDNVLGAYEILYDRFIFICIKPMALSGCSIDSSVRVFKDLREKHALDALDRNLVHYREGTGIKSLYRDSFGQMVGHRPSPDNLIVFNNTIETLGEYRKGLWECDFNQSWHARVFIA